MWQKLADFLNKPKDPVCTCSHLYSEHLDPDNSDKRFQFRAHPCTLCSCMDFVAK